MPPLLDIITDVLSIIASIVAVIAAISARRDKNEVTSIINSKMISQTTYNINAQMVKMGDTGEIHDVKISD